MYERLANFVNLASFEPDSKENNFSEEKLAILAQSLTNEILTDYVWTDELKAIQEKLSQEIFDDFDASIMEDKDIKCLIFKSVLGTDFLALNYTLMMIGLFASPTLDIAKQRIQRHIEDASNFAEIWKLGQTLTLS